MTSYLHTTDMFASIVADHLWQSTLVAVGAAILCMVLRRHAAWVRHTICLAASAKFLVPFAWLAAIGTVAPWPVPTFTETPVVVSTVWSLGQPFAPRIAERGHEPGLEAAGDTPIAPILTAGLLATWIAGSFIVAVRRSIAVRRAGAIRRRSRPLDHGREAGVLARVAGQMPGANVALRSSSGPDSPCVIGIVRPMLLWPAGISDDLSDRQLEAIMRHELAHVRRRDNLAGAIHAIVEICFWFHPLVWWLSGRLVTERERACDETVLAAGAAPADYADAILRICDRSIETSVAAVGITDSVLGRRMEAIMSASALKSPGGFVKASLAAVAVGMIVGPVALGAFGAQETSPGSTGRISGVVTDQMGGVVAGADVTVRARATGSTRTAVSDRFGRYAVTDLTPGSHEVRATQAGFRPYVLEVTVYAGRQAIVHARLRVGSVTESVTLVADAQRRDHSPRVGPAQIEAQLIQEINERPEDAQPQLSLAEFYYREERFAESAITMERAAGLWAARKRIEASGQPPVPFGAITAPRMISKVNPIYPEAARTAGVAGTVILEGTIGEDGTVQDARVLRGVPLLNDAALGAVRQWLYEPTRLNGVPIAVVMQTTVTFASN
jgi:TonB family protein